jgi:hypothetical protein
MPTGDTNGSRASCSTRPPCGCLIDPGDVAERGGLVGPRRRPGCGSPASVAGRGVGITGRALPTAAAGREDGA